MAISLRQQEVGRRVRQLRGHVGLSVRALAARTDFSPSFISQLENGLVSPSIHSMEKIANVLGESLGAFFAAIGPGEGGLVVRRQDRSSLESSWSQAQIQSLAAARRFQRLEPLLITLQPGGRSGKHPVPHRGEEFVMILKGRVTLRLGPDEFKLSAGDSATVLPGELRLFTNESRTVAEILIVSLATP